MEHTKKQERRKYKNMINGITLPVSIVTNQADCYYIL